MAAALRFVARKVCGRALERPQAFFTTVASSAVKEEQRWLLPRISHGGSSLIRRFSSSESPTLLNNNKQHLNLATRVEETKQELHHLLRQTDHLHAEKSAMEKLKNKLLLQLLERRPTASSSSSSSSSSTDEYINTLLDTMTMTGLNISVGCLVFLLVSKFRYG